MTVTLEVANPAVLTLLQDMEYLDLVHLEEKLDEHAGTPRLKGQYLGGARENFHTTAKMAAAQKLKQGDSSRIYAGCLNGKNIFRGDPAAIQRKMRDEW